MEAIALVPIVEAAVLAPSVENTQPWRFALHPGVAKTASIDLFADRSRLLSVADPSGRELHISCGAAIEFARVAGRGLGLDCRVELLPDPADEDHLARLVFEGEELPTATDLSLAQALPHRYTERGPFEDRVVPDGLVERLRQCVLPFEAWLKVLEPGADQTTAAVLLGMADEIASAWESYEAEAALWRRSEPGQTDGLPAYLEERKLAGRASSFKLRGSHSSGPQSGLEEAPPPAEHPLVAVIGTPGDEPYYWLQAGRALGRLLVTAAAQGVSASPMTQILEIEPTRALLTRELRLVGRPQVLLRMGYAHGEPSAPRRPIEEVLIDGPDVPQAS